MARSPPASPTGPKLNGVSSNSTTYITTDQVNEATDFINQATTEAKPWLMWLSFTAPHAPYHKPPAELLSPRFESLTGTSADINARRRDYFEVPAGFLHWVGSQMRIDPSCWPGYFLREATCREHLPKLRSYPGLRPFALGASRFSRSWQ